MIGTIQPEKTHEGFWREAQAYHKTAINGRNTRPEIFNNEIVFNMLGMVIEKYFMAFLTRNGEIADNHTFTDLVDSVARVRPVPEDLAQRLRALDITQNLCPLYEQELPEEYTEEMIERIIRAAEEVHAFTQTENGEVCV